MLAEACDVRGLPCFAEGWVSVQDEAAQLSADLLELAPGQRVLDACCAPGGKTCHLLEAEAGLAHVVAIDLEAKRLTRVRENLDRLRLDAELIACDARDTASWWDGKPFQRILLDAPCSATGVIRRHPDIKLTRQADDIPAPPRCKASCSMPCGRPRKWAACCCMPPAPACRPRTPK